MIAFNEINQKPYVPYKDQCSFGRIQGKIQSSWVPYNFPQLKQNRKTQIFLQLHQNRFLNLVKTHFQGGTELCVCSVLNYLINIGSYLPEFHSTRLELFSNLSIPSNNIRPAWYYISALPGVVNMVLFGFPLFGYLKVLADSRVYSCKDFI